jgi:hypothetical protein
MDPAEQNPSDPAKKDTPNEQGGFHELPRYAGASVKLVQAVADSPKVKTEPQKNHPSRWEKATVIILAMTFFAALAAAIFTGWLAISTQTLVVDARQTAERQIRSYVFAKPYPWVNSIEPGQQANSAVFLRNAGQTPASNLNLQASLTKTAPQPNVDDFIRAEVQNVDSVLDPSTEVRTWNQVDIDDRLTPEEFATVKDRKTSLYVWGTVTYDDVFNLLHHSYFCFVFTGATPSPDGGIGARHREFCRTPKSD